MPTVTMLARAGVRVPNRWRSSTARAPLPARRCTLTSSRRDIAVALRPNAAACCRSQARAASSGSLEVARPRDPSAGRIEDGVPNRLKRASTAPRSRRAARCAGAGSAVPRASRSASPTVGSRRDAPGAGRSPVAAGAATAGSWVSPGTRVTVSRARPAAAYRPRRGGVGVMRLQRCACPLVMARSWWPRREPAGHRWWSGRGPAPAGAAGTAALSSRVRLGTFQEFR